MRWTEAGKRMRISRDDRFATLCPAQTLACCSAATPRDTTKIGEEPKKEGPKFKRALQYAISLESLFDRQEFQFRFFQVTM